MCINGLKKHISSGVFQTEKPLLRLFVHILPQVFLYNEEEGKIHFNVDSGLQREMELCLHPTPDWSRHIWNISLHHGRWQTGWSGPTGIKSSHLHFIVKTTAIPEEMILQNQRGLDLFVMR